MVYGYIRVSTDKQTVENQRFEIQRFCSKQKLEIGWWIEETISRTKSPEKRLLGSLLKVLAFAFGLSAEIERDLISQWTKEALARRKNEGVILGRPVGCKSQTVKLSGHEKEIEDLLAKHISKA
jgi:DNA invertase Pin-like site-specific DNA recombinase